MDAIEMFAGIGGFRVGADAVGLNTVWANDTCVKACRVYRARFGASALHEGDVNSLRDKVPAHDFLTGGFPCQPFSSAGKKKGIGDPRGTLFSTIVDVLREHQPRFFVLENVKRLLSMEQGVHFATILSSLADLNYDMEWRLLNAQHFGLPQNRQRVLITGVRAHSAPDKVTTRLTSPDDLEIRAVNHELIEHPELWTDIVSHGKKFTNWGLARRGKFYGANLTGFSEQSAPVLLQAVLERKVAAQFDFTESTIERIKVSQPVRKFVDGVEILSNQSGGARMGYTVFGINGVAPTLTSTASRHYERYEVGDRYRRLTNVEYARIQGFPDDHCSSVSIYDQYALYGNAVPPPMVEWVMRRVLTEGNAIRQPRRRPRQRSLFSNSSR